MTRFDDLLRTGLRSARAPEPHLDADQLSAFAENRMGRALVTAHAARCQECREALFLLSGERLAPAPARGWRWAWIPAAAAVCALGVGIPILLHRSPHPPAQVIARALPPPQAKVEAETARQPMPLPMKTTFKKAPAKGKVDDERIPSVVQAEPPMAAPPPVEQSQTLPAAGQPPQTAAPPAAGQQQDAVRQLNQQVAQSAKPPSPGVSFFTPQQASATQKYRVMPGFAKVAPARARQWTINQGVPEQSGDAGISWRQVPIDASIRFQAIGNLANDVWAGGSGGALLHSNDSGEHWRRVKVADGAEALTSDIIEIRVTTRMEIRVLSASGERWATDDGGRTWKRE